MCGGSCLCYCRQWKYHLSVAACEGTGISCCVSCGEDESVFLQGRGELWGEGGGGWWSLVVLPVEFVSV